MSVYGLTTHLTGHVGDEGQNCSVLYNVYHSSVQSHAQLLILLLAVVTDKIGPVGLGCVFFLTRVCFFLLLALDAFVETYHRAIDVMFIRLSGRTCIVIIWCTFARI